jgi:hypothetical protein
MTPRAGIVSMLSFLHALERADDRAAAHGTSGDGTPVLSARA